MRSPRLTEAELDKALWRKGLLDDERKLGLEFFNFAFYQLGIELHPGQVAFVGMVLKRRNNSHVARFLTLMLTSGNRAGKTALLAIIVIYSCLGKLNSPRPDLSDDKSVMAWGKREYNWWHFGIRQEVSDLVFNSIVRILSGTHEAQSDGCPLTEHGPIADWDSKEYSEYGWIKFRPEVGGAQIHFRTTGAKSLGQLGQSMNGVSFDEAGIESNLDFLIKEVFDFRRLDTGGQLIMVSTPSEELGTAFADNWDTGDPLNPHRKDSWYSMRMSTRDNIGYGLTQEMFDILIKDMDERTIQQNVDGIFLQGKSAYFSGVTVDRCFIEEMPELTTAQNGHVYIQGVDPGLTDRCWSLVFDLVGGILYGVKAEFSRSKTTEDIVALAVDNHNAYEMNRRGMKTYCITAIDTTALGGHIFRELVQESLPEVASVEFGGNTQAKRKLIGDLKTTIDEGRIFMPRHGDWMLVRRQLAGYKVSDRAIEQDAVMALACVVKMVRRMPSDGVEEGVAFDAFAV